jgi:nucleoside-diphosphate-sugar epimerase
MRIAVTGATGFVGGALADHLDAAGHEILAIGRRPRPDSMRHRYERWDLGLDGPAPPGVAACEAVVHAAAHVAPWGPDGPFRAVTVLGTERLLRAVDPTARLVVIGSASVYDPRVPHLSVREPEGPVAAGRYLNAYARAKADQERLIATARPDAIILRPRAVWGPGDTTLLPRILARIRNGWLPLPDGGRHLASTTHISSLAAAVLAAIERPGVSGPVNVADATPTTTSALLGTLLDALEMRVRIVPVPASVAWIAAGALEAAWSLAGRRSEPFLTRYAVAGLSHPFTLDLGRLRGELGVGPDVDVHEASRSLAADQVAAAAHPDRP